MKAWKFTAVAALVIGLADSLSAQVTIFTATLNAAQEVPPNGSSGTGSGTLQLNTTTGVWNLSGTFSGLIGLTNDAHIHGPAVPGVSAGPVVGISYTSGATSGTFSGSGTFNSTQMNDLLSGLYYVNIHTTAYGGGEIRGQLTAVPEPSTYALGAGAAALTVAMIRRKRQRVSAA